MLVQYNAGYHNDKFLIFQFFLIYIFLNENVLNFFIFLKKIGAQTLRCQIAGPQMSSHPKINTQTMCVVIFSTERWSYCINKYLSWYNTLYKLLNVVDSPKISSLEYLILFILLVLKIINAVIPNVRPKNCFMGKIDAILWEKFSVGKN